MSERLTRLFASRWGIVLAGAVIGVLFLKSSYNLGRSSATYIAVGWVIPAVMVGMLLLRIFAPQVSENGAAFFSESGPGAKYAPLLISLGAGLIIGLFAQRTRFCTMGSVRDVILMGDTHLISGLVALVAVAFGMNLLPGQFNFGLLGQPVAHSQHLWNFLGMTLAGLAFALAGGCPGRRLFLSGERDGDAGVFVLGMITGAGLAHNFALADGHLARECAARLGEHGLCGRGGGAGRRV